MSAIIDYVHRLNNQIIKPLNANFNADFSFGEYTDDNSFNFLPNATIEQDSLILVGEDMNIVRQWIADERIFEGIPYTLQFKGTGEMIYNIGEACLDLTDIKFESEPDRYTLKIVDKRAVFAEQANALNLRVLLKQGIFTKQDYEPINYVYKAVPDYMQSFLLTLTTYQLGKEIKEQIKNLAKDLADVFPVGVGTIKAGIEVVYIAAMIVQIEQLIEQLTETLFQRVRYYYAINIKTLLIKACAYFGYSFESSILDSNEFIDTCLICPKSEKGTLFGKTSKDDGVPSNTLKEIFAIVTSLFNAKLKIDGNVIRMERWDYFIEKATPSVVIKNIRNESFRDIPIRTNAAELKSNITFTFGKDDSDYTTYQNRQGFSAQIHTKLKSVLNTKFAFLKGIKQVNPNVTRASRKNTQSSLEKALAIIIDAYEVFTGATTSLKGKRIGCLELPQDAFGIMKIAKIKNGFLSTNNDKIINADYLLKNFYEINSGLKNQQKSYSQEIEHPFTITEVLELRKSGVAILENGKKCLVEKLKFIQDKGLYLITVRWFENYCNNLENIYTES